MACAQHFVQKVEPKLTGSYLTVGSCWGCEELDSMEDVVNNGRIPNRGCGCRCTQSVCVGSRLCIQLRVNQHSQLHFAG